MASKKLTTTIEEYFRKALDENIIDHSIRASISREGYITFYIHPSGRDGETVDFTVRNNQLITVCYARLPPSLIKTQEEPLGQEPVPLN